MNFLFINVSLIFRTLLVIKPRITSKNYLLHQKKFKKTQKEYSTNPKHRIELLKGKKTELTNEQYLLHLSAGNSFLKDTFSFNYKFIRRIT